jgi:hypothetical protein
MDRDRGQSSLWQSQAHCSAAAIDQRPDPDDSPSCFFNALHGFAGRSTCRDDILNNDGRLALCQLEASPKLHHAILSFSEKSPRAQGPCHLMRHQHSSQSGGHNHRGIEMPELCCKCCAQLLRHLWELQNQRALNIAVAMQPGRKNKMPLQEGVVFVKNFQHFLIIHNEPSESGVDERPAPSPPQ